MHTLINLQYTIDIFFENSSVALESLLSENLILITERKLCPKENEKRKKKEIREKSRWTVMRKFLVLLNMKMLTMENYSV